MFIVAFAWLMSRGCHLTVDTATGVSLASIVPSCVTRVELAAAMLLKLDMPFRCEATIVMRSTIDKSR
jgi:hypothetical protein